MKKNVISQIELVITTKCSLKCKHCAHLIPHYCAFENGPAHADTNEILETIRKLLDVVDKIDIFRVLGGEPFLHPEMYKIVDELKKSEKLERIEVVTNATIVPSGNNLECLKGENLFVRISNYGENSVKKEKLIECLENIKVKYTIHDCMKNKWGDLGEPFERKRTIQELERIYEKCFSRSIFIILDGKIYLCGRSAHSIKMGFSPADDFCIDILNGNKSSIIKGLNDLNNIRFLKTCDYCDGRRLGERYKEVEPAIQFTNSEIKRLKQNQGGCEI
ncbi:MAG: radical SAM protein [Fibromonadaceae bacterium]|jgi:MoaA/NifB/PqqE/SkfB family radical SAM enzyme|nr:radical SAM protein [Fibromonadaceae bacterium]